MAFEQRTGPLEGIRILDLDQSMAAAMMLGDLLAFLHASSLALVRSSAQAMDELGHGRAAALRLP